MRIAVVMLGGEYYGTQMMGVSQAAILARMGHQVTLFALGDSDLLKVNPGTKVEFLRHLPGLLPWKRPCGTVFCALPPPLHLPFIYRCIRPLSNFELVIACDEFVSWIGYYAKKLYGLKYIYFPEGGTRFIKSKEPMHRKVYYHLVDCWMRKCCSKADIVATESIAGKEAFKERFGIQSIVTGGVVDLSLFNPGVNGKSVRDSYCLGNAPLILYVDRLDPGKGVDILIDAFYLVHESIPSARLMLIGKSCSRSYREQLQARCDEAVVFVDYVPHSELPVFYAACTIFATCLVWEEGFSHTIVEAQACGKPVVAFKLAPHEEVVKDWETGILVGRVGDTQEVALAMLRLLTDRSLANALGHKAADWASYLAGIGARNMQELMETVASL